MRNKPFYLTIPVFFLAISAFYDSGQTFQNLEARTSASQTVLEWGSCKTLDPHETVPLEDGRTLEVRK